MILFALNLNFRAYFVLMGEKGQVGDKGEL